MSSLVAVVGKYLYLISDQCICVGYFQHAVLLHYIESTHIITNSRGSDLLVLDKRNYRQKGV